MLVKPIRAFETVLTPEEVIDGAHGRRQGHVVVAEVLVVVVFGALGVAVKEEGFDGGCLRLENGLDRLWR